MIVESEVCINLYKIKSLCDLAFICKSSSIYAVGDAEDIISKARRKEQLRISLRTYLVILTISDMTVKAATGSPCLRYKVFFDFFRINKCLYKIVFGCKFQINLLCFFYTD